MVADSPRVRETPIFHYFGKDQGKNGGAMSKAHPEGPLGLRGKVDPNASGSEVVRLGCRCQVFPGTDQGLPNVRINYISWFFLESNTSLTRQI